ncbi:hypothetical protein CDO73_16740, partial [Saccharibacillus sp. O23]|uniref:hypothetical protein n=1 Tax=Saccharibacillus sp. O23 TaxID=2009338 RepID=UPI000B654308
RPAGGGAPAESAGPARSSGRAPAEQVDAPTQRVFVKIAADRRNPELLETLKSMLQSRPGPMPTLLFYEDTQKLIALSDAYRIQPSPELFAQMEGLLGEGTVRVK